MTPSPAGPYRAIERTGGGMTGRWMVDGPTQIVGMDDGDLAADQARWLNAAHAAARAACAEELEAVIDAADRFAGALIKMQSPADRVMARGRMLDGVSEKLAEARALAATWRTP
jgi:hypothetical protein